MGTRVRCAGRFDQSGRRVRLTGRDVMLLREPRVCRNRAPPLHAGEGERERASGRLGGRGNLGLIYG